MAVGKIFRPRRGKNSTMVTKDTVLAKGEFFVEVPENGVGTGIGKMKMGDGVTPYSSLPYLINPMDSKFEYTIYDAEDSPNVDPHSVGNFSSLSSQTSIDLARCIGGGDQTVRYHNAIFAELLRRLCTSGLLDKLYDVTDEKQYYLPGIWFNLWSGASTTPSVTINSDSPIATKMQPSYYQSPILFMVSGYSTSTLSSGSLALSDLKTFIVPMSLEVGYRAGYTGISQAGYFNSSVMAQTIGATLSRNSSGDLLFSVITDLDDLLVTADFYITNIRVLVQQ